MTRSLSLLPILWLSTLCVFAQNKTAISLRYKNKPDSILSQVHSQSGNLFDSLLHHGPAVENEWLALRMYFDKRASIDVYSKQRQALELEEAKWYPTAAQQKKGWGADYYKVGTTLGLGGVRLWDGEKVIQLDPVTHRGAKVVKEGNAAYMEMLSEGIPYKNGVVDILVRVTVFSGIREAKVEAFALADKEVQFVTGVNYHKGQTVKIDSNYLLTWGLHPEDVAVEKIEIGAAIVFNPTDFETQKDDGTQHLLISKPTKLLSYWITSANQKEKKINTLNGFTNSAKQLSHDVK